MDGFSGAGRCLGSGAPKWPPSEPLCVSGSRSAWPEPSEPPERCWSKPLTATDRFPVARDQTAPRDPLGELRASAAAPIVQNQRRDRPVDKLRASHRSRRLPSFIYLARSPTWNSSRRSSAIPALRSIRPSCTWGYSGSASKRPASANLSASDRVLISHNQRTRNCGSRTSPLSTKDRASSTRPARASAIACNK